MKTNLFTREFLDLCSSQCGAKSCLNHLMEEHNFSFHDAVLKVTFFHGLTPEYIDHEKIATLQKDGNIIIDQIRAYMNGHNPKTMP